MDIVTGYVKVVRVESGTEWVFWVTSRFSFSFSEIYFLNYFLFVLCSFYHERRRGAPLGSLWRIVDIHITYVRTRYLPVTQRQVGRDERARTIGKEKWNGPDWQVPSNAVRTCWHFVACCWFVDVVLDVVSVNGDIVIVDVAIVVHVVVVVVVDVVPVAVIVVAVVIRLLIFVFIWRISSF